MLQRFRRLIRHVVILYPLLATPNFYPDLYADPFGVIQANQQKGTI